MKRSFGRRLVPPDERIKGAWILACFLLLAGSFPGLAFVSVGASASTDREEGIGGSSLDRPDRTSSGEAVNAALAHLEARRPTLGQSGVAGFALDEQLMNLHAIKDIVAVRDGTERGEKRTFSLAEEALKQQGNLAHLGTSMSEQRATISGKSDGRDLRALVWRMAKLASVTLGPRQTDQINQLEARPDSFKDAFAGVIVAYLEFDAATKNLLEGAGKAPLDISGLNRIHSARLQTLVAVRKLSYVIESDFQIPGQRKPLDQSPAQRAVDEGLGSETSPPDPAPTIVQGPSDRPNPQDADPVPASTFSPRPSNETTPQGNARLPGPTPLRLSADGVNSVSAKEAVAPSCPDLDLPGVICLDLSANSNRYTQDYRILLDRAGSDIYENNAGGGRNGSASLLMDLAGDDCYGVQKQAGIPCFSATAGPRGSGVNGGGFVGSGFLVDLGGNDRYIGGDAGVNGGGSTGSGFLLDAAGADLYLADGISSGQPAVRSAVNGGANLGLGLLFDGGEQNDVYRGSDSGTNGGALGTGMGLLLDESGDDQYIAGSKGTNGGAFESGRGMLVDMEGRDTYSAGGTGTNGGTVKSGIGFLADLGPGNDRYQGGSSGVNGGSESVDSSTVGSGLLLDEQGDDIYRGHSSGVNGGSSRVINPGPGAGNATANKSGGFGSLLDLAGVDAYLAEGEGVNGGAFGKGMSLLVGATTGRHPGTGQGLLLDAGGVGDRYRDDEDGGGPPERRDEDGYGTDVTVVPKGRSDDGLPPSGAQIDASDAPIVLVSVSDATVTEGNSGQVPAEFAVTLSRPADQTIRVEYATEDGTAESRSDYLLTSGIVEFAPGETRRAVQVPVLGDVDVEANETFFVNLSNASGANVGDAQGQGTIVNDDGGLTLGDTQVIEGDSGTTVAVFPVQLPEPNTTTVTVDYATRDGSASKEDDYEETSGTLTFQPGQTVDRIEVPVNGDLKPEPDEDLLVVLSNAKNSGIADGEGQGIIRNDDGGLSVLDASVDEGDSGANNATFVVLLGKPSSEMVEVRFDTADGTARQGDQDYMQRSGTLTFLPGQTASTVTIPVYPDTQVEEDEFFHLVLSDARNADIADGEAKGSILNDDGGLLVNDVEVFERDVEGNAAEFTVSLLTKSSRPVRVDYSTADGTAVSPSDYAAQSGTLTFLPGELSKSVKVPIMTDAIPEGRESFYLNLSGQINATLLDGTGTGTILDWGFSGRRPGSDGPGGVFASGHDPDFHYQFPTLEQQFPLIQLPIEHSTRKKTGTLRMLLFSSGFGTPSYAGYPLYKLGFAYPCSGGAMGPRGCFDFGPGFDRLGDGSVDLETVDFAQYDVIFAASTSSQNHHPILTKRKDELAQFVSTGGSLVAYGASGDIGHSSNPGPNLNTPFILTGHYFNFLPCLEPPCASDRAANFPQQEIGFRLTPTGEAMGLKEEDVNKYQSHNYFIDSEIRGYDAVDVDPLGHTISIFTFKQPCLTSQADRSMVISDASGPEGNVGSSFLSFTVTLDCPSSRPITVRFRTEDGSASLGDQDYSQRDGTLAFSPGQTKATIQVPVIGDTRLEPDEYFAVRLDSPQGAYIQVDEAKGIIQNDDEATTTNRRPGEPVGLIAAPLGQQLGGGGGVTSGPSALAQFPAPSTGSAGGAQQIAQPPGMQIHLLNQEQAQQALHQEALSRAAQRHSQVEAELHAAPMMQHEQERQGQAAPVESLRSQGQKHMAIVRGRLLPVPLGGLGALGAAFMYVVALGGRNRNRKLQTLPVPRRPQSNPKQRTSRERRRR